VVEELGPAEVEEEQSAADWLMDSLALALMPALLEVLLG
jgi:hypothetical protein